MLRHGKKVADAGFTPIPKEPLNLPKKSLVMTYVAVTTIIWRERAFYGILARQIRLFSIRYV